MFPLKILLSALVAPLLMASVQAETNVIIDDTDPRIVYQPPGVWLFEGNTALTQDRWNKTTHFTSVLGATASFTFTDAFYVYYVGYGIKEMPPPALIPITLQPHHGNAITVQTDSYRPAGAQTQITLFSSNRLDPTETYTITVTKTNATLAHGVNIDSFILTQPSSADSTSASLAQTTVAGDTTLISTATAPVIPIAVTDTIITTSSSSAQSTPVRNADSRRIASLNTAAITGGVLGGIAVGITIAFLIFRWWLKRNQQKKRGLVGLPSALYTDETRRPVYFAAAPTYPSKRSGTPPQVATPATTNGHSVPSRSVSTPLLTPASTDLGQISVDGHTDMFQVQQVLPYNRERQSTWGTVSLGV